MKKTRLTKTLVALLIALLLTLAPITVFAAPPQALTVEQLIEKYEENITRAEFAMLINAVLSLPQIEGTGFTDVPADHPYAADIYTARAIGYMNGYGKGIFRPDGIISGAEAAVCVNYFLGFDLTKVQPNDLTTVPGWAKAAVSNLLDLHMVTLELTDKTALTVADALGFATALMTALMFQGSPYALMQANEKDDFYAFNNRQFLATATPPPGYIVAMAFLGPEINVQNQMSALLSEILSDGGAPGSDAWKIGELFNMYMDQSGRTASVQKIMPIVEDIKAAASISELNAVAAKYFSIMNLQNFYGIAVTSDAMVDNTKWCIVLVPGGFMLGARDYYVDVENFAPIHEALRRYIASVLAYVGETEDLESRAQAVFDVEQLNAILSMPLEIFNDPKVIYTESSWDEIDSATTGSGTMNYSPELREALKDANIYCPDMDYIRHIESLYTEENLGVLKDFAIINAISTFSQLIGDDFGALASELQTVMFGEGGEGLSLELRAQRIVTNIMSGTFSKLYADKYVSPETKADVMQIVELVRDKYRERIVSLDWMSEETKQMAIEKLDAIKAFVAYPDEYGATFSYIVKGSAEGGNLVDFYIDNANAAHDMTVEKLKQPYEADIWGSLPTYTVNAFYTPTENAIIIPAGILQEPFYSVDAKREVNLGGIGAIIAHEISHAFDDNGAQYDKYGTITDWWTEDDYAAFGELTQQVSTALSEVVFIGDMRVNGALCTGETISDLGAMACILDIADDMVGADLALVMRSWAHIWAARMSAEVVVYYLLADTHAPHKVRANFILSHLDDFYTVFGITVADGMYIAPEYRISIW